MKIPKRFHLSNYQAYVEISQIIDPTKLQYLAANCPGLATFDWRNYLYCSMWRVEQVLDELCELGFYRLPFTLKDRAPSVLDFGSWLGNFSLSLKYLGWDVTACEFWQRYGSALRAHGELLENCAVHVVDFTPQTSPFLNNAFDVLLLMSVIEHIPHTPKFLLQTLFDFLRPGGYLILDTPNLAYIANRRRLNCGISPYVPINEQFETEIPFEGHNREYTANELSWMLEKVGFQMIETRFFNYSMYGVSHPYLMNARSIIPMLLDPTKRELIFVVARKPLADARK